MSSVSSPSVRLANSESFLVADELGLFIRWESASVHFVLFVIRSYRRD